jgi:Rab-3A-interacting protein
MKETAAVPSPSSKKSPIGKGLLMVPKTAGVLKHRRAGSTGTTGDESYTTDEEDNVEIDEPDLHVPTKLFNHDSSDFGSFSDIATITDKVMHRNSSDSSVYSDLGLEKLEKGEDQGDWARQVVGAKEQTFARLQDELRDAHQELKLKDEEVARLSRIRQDVEAELEDLTASLFQEAHNMVREANEKQAASEKALKESQMKVDVLTAEVAALKTLVLTSTPSRPNPHLHPQIDSRIKEENKKHRRSPSHFNLKYGRENSPPESPVKEVHHIPCEVESKEGLEVDPNVHKEFLAWRQKPCLDKDDPFVRRVYVEDIDQCLAFNNDDLSRKVRRAVETGTILIEAVGDRTKAMFPKKCALLEVPRLCFYRMNIGEADNWYSISQICRNRVRRVEFRVRKRRNDFVRR